MVVNVQLVGSPGNPINAALQASTILSQIASAERKLFVDVRIEGLASTASVSPLAMSPPMTTRLVSSPSVTCPKAVNHSGLSRPVVVDVIADDCGISDEADVTASSGLDITVDIKEINWSVPLGVFQEYWKLLMAAAVTRRLFMVVRRCAAGKSEQQSPDCRYFSEYLHKKNIEVSGKTSTRWLPRQLYDDKFVPGQGELFIIKIIILF